MPSAASFADALLEGVQSGPIKQLPGFRKGMHFVPKDHSDAANAFIGKIGAERVQAEAEQIVQDLRSAFSYRRKEMSFACEEGSASIEGPDFTAKVELGQAPENPAQYELRTTVEQFRRPEIVSEPAFASVFSRYCNRVVFLFQQAVDLEEKIDLIEEQDGWRDCLEYAPDGSELTLEFPEPRVRIRLTPHRMELSLPGSPDLALLISSVLRTLEALHGSGVEFKH